jgi:hypothetical protein
LHTERRLLDEEAGAEFNPQVSDYKHGSTTVSKGVGTVTEQLYGINGSLMLD